MLLVKEDVAPASCIMTIGGYGSPDAQLRI
jgi:hypothetical protein